MSSRSGADETDRVREWARRARGGCEASFERLVRTYAGRLYGFLRARGAGDHDAEDIAQETWMRALRNLDRYDPQKPFAPWLFTIGARLHIDHGRARKETIALDRVPEPETSSPPDADLETREMAAAFWTTARRSVSADEYEALWLHYREGMTVKEMAAVTGKGESNVKVLLHRGRARLGQALGGESNSATSERGRGATASPPLPTIP